MSRAETEEIMKKTHIKKVKPVIQESSGPTGHVCTPAKDP